MTKAHRPRPSLQRPSSPGRPPPPALSAPPLPAPAAVSAPSGPARGSRLLPSAPAPASLPFRCRGGGSRAPADRAATAAGGGRRGGGGGGVVRRRRCGGRAEPARSWRWGNRPRGRQHAGRRGAGRLRGRGLEHLHDLGRQQPVPAHHRTGEPAPRAGRPALRPRLPARRARPPQGRPSGRCRARLQVRAGGSAA